MSTIVQLNERKTFSRPRREQNNGYRIKNTEGRAASLSGSRLYGIVNTTEDREHVKTAAEQTSVNTNDYVHNAKFAADQPSVNTNDDVHDAKFAMQLRHLLLLLLHQLNVLHQLNGYNATNAKNGMNYPLILM